VTLAFDIAGDGPPLVLLHGFTGSRATWTPLRGALARRWRTIAVDLPGHGASPAPTGDLRALAAALVGVLDRLDLGRAHWLGYSLGGRAALHVAVAHPERVDGLVLESTSPGIAQALARRERIRSDTLLADAIRRDGLDAFIERWTAQPLFATQRRLPDDVRARERAIRATNTADGLAAALLAFSPGRQEPLWSRLPEVGARTLLVAGARDPTYRAHAEAMAARMPHAAVAVVPDAGHTVHLEDPVAFTAAVDAFLAAV
jgi:2-succinyl-6-hydroxy-2,4-cyclohexadiene-1-carboxylate synthase